MSRTRFVAFALVLLVLIGIGMFRYVRMNNAHRNDLFTMRSVINQYTLEKQHAPRSVNELVEAGYLQRNAATDTHVQQLFREAASQ